MSLFPIVLVGSFPKPKYLKIPSWFDGSQFGYSAQLYSNYMKQHNNAQHQESLQKAFNEVIQEQINLGGDIITDGEIDRENYIWHFCRHCLNGFDFKNLKKVVSRNGVSCVVAPQITEKISLKSDALDLMANQWTQLQKHCRKPIKIQIPGPMTIMDSTYNEYYNNNKEELLFDLSDCINKYILYLTNNTDLKFIQIDEPVFTRKPEMAKDIGFKAMKKCLENVPKYVYKSVHICCGYFDEVDTKYEKADNHSYVKLVQYGMDSFLYDECGINGITIEDAHSRVPMKFFKLINKLDIILGVVKVCETRVISNSTNEIVDRVHDIIKFGKIKPKKLLLAPDCGLAMLPLDVVRKKMKSLLVARDILRSHYQSKL
eukprot:426083_1